MNPLKRNNPGVRATDHEDRIQVLERRIFPYGLSWAMASRSSNQLIDNNAELIVFNAPDFLTNDTDIFELSSGNDGILVKDIGMFETAGMIESATGTAINRRTYVQAELESAYPTFGNEYGRNFYALDTSLLDETIIRQNHHAFGTMGGSATAPYMATLVAQRLGGINYTVSFASLVVIKVGEYPE